MKWGIAVAATVATLVLFVLTILFGKPAGRTAPKVEEQIAYPVATVGGLGPGDEQRNVDQNNPTGSIDSIAGADSELGLLYAIPAGTMTKFRNVVQSSAELGLSSTPDRFGSMKTIDLSDERIGNLSDADPLVLVVANDPQPIACLLSDLCGDTSAVFNVRVGERALTLTWCSDSKSILVFSSVVDGIELEFASKGERFRENLVLVDKQTETRWAQLIGLGLHGQLQYTRLSMVSAQIVRWSELHAAFPQAIWIESAAAPANISQQNERLQALLNVTRDWGMSYVLQDRIGFHLLRFLNEKKLVLDDDNKFPMMFVQDSSGSSFGFLRENVEQKFEQSGSDPVTLGRSIWEIQPGGSGKWYFVDADDNSKRLPPIPLIYTRQSAWDRFFGK